MYLIIAMNNIPTSTNNRILSQLHPQIPRAPYNYRSSSQVIISRQVRYMLRSSGLCFRRFYQNYNNKRLQRVQAGFIFVSCQKKSFCVDNSPNIVPNFSRKAYWLTHTIRDGLIDQREKVYHSRWLDSFLFYYRGSVYQEKEC